MSSQTTNEHPDRLWSDDKQSEKDGCVTTNNADFEVYNRKQVVKNYTIEACDRLADKFGIKDKAHEITWQELVEYYREPTLVVTPEAHKYWLMIKEEIPFHGIWTEGGVVPNNPAFLNEKFYHYITQQQKEGVRASFSATCYKAWLDSSDHIMQSTCLNGEKVTRPLQKRIIKESPSAFLTVQLMASAFRGCSFIGIWGAANLFNILPVEVAVGISKDYNFQQMVEYKKALQRHQFGTQPALHFIFPSNMKVEDKFNGILKKKGGPKKNFYFTAEDFRKSKPELVNCLQAVELQVSKDLYAFEQERAKSRVNKPARMQSN
jgi:hypothetical protein